MAASYTAKDILVLEGLEPVRRRPGMYIGGVDATGLHHLLWEIVDNSVDEAMNGHADRIAVTLHKDGASVTVTDNGRGIPVDRHAQYKKPALELILTTLHAGGKFEAKNYFHSGGLHGVGASVVTALSREAGRAREARRRRVGAVVRARRGHRTAQEARRRARQRHDHLLPSRPARSSRASASTPKLHRRDASRPRPTCTAASPSSFATRRPARRPPSTTRTACAPISRRSSRETRRARRSAARSSPSSKEQDDLHLDCALAWTEDTGERVLSFVNSIPTISGGAHENGLKAGLVKAVRNYLTVHNLVPRGLTIAAEDAREGLVARARDQDRAAAVPGADEGAPQQRRGHAGHRRHRAHRARERAERQPHGRRRDRQPRHPGRAGAQRVARGGAAGRSARAPSRIA